MVCLFLSVRQELNFSRYVLQTNKCVLVVFVCWCITTSSLHILQFVQVWPINPIVCREPQQTPQPTTGFPLRCFQRLSLPYVASQPSSWLNNWHNRCTSVPVPSY